MSHNCKSPFAATQRDANNNMYSGGGGGGSHGCSAKGFGGSTLSANNKGFQQQVTAKVLFGTVAAINELKLQERAAREARRTH